MKLFKHPKHKSFNFVEAASIFTELLPEIAFFGGSTESTLDSYDQITVPDSIQNTIGITWNGIDAGCSLIAALLLLLDKKDHYQAEKNAKVAVLITSTLQGTILSALNFGSPALVISLGIDLCMAVQVLYKEAKKATLRGWFEDAFIKKSHIKKLLEETLDAETSANLNKQLDQLDRDIKARINVQCQGREKSRNASEKAYNIIKSVCESFQENQFDELLEFNKSIIDTKKDKSQTNPPDYSPDNATGHLSDNFLTKGQIEIDKAIQDEANQDRTNQALLVFFKAATLAAVVGITITAPALVTLIVVSLTAATYIFNHGKQWHNKHQQSKNKEAEGSQEERQRLVSSSSLMSPRRNNFGETLVPKPKETYHRELLCAGYAR